MAKSRLTTKEIVDICTTHCGSATAEQCGITKHSVCAGQNPTAVREKGAKRHRGLCEMRRRAYMAAQSARHKKHQQESLAHATRHNARYMPTEEEYVRTNAGRLSVLKMAIALGRTYFSVRGFTSSRKIEMRKS